MNVASVIGSVFAVVFCLGLLALAGVIVWFGVVGAVRRKGRLGRLHRPELAAIESKWGVKLPASVEAYFGSPAVDRGDFYLAPPGTSQAEWWYVAQFLPLTRRDLSDWISITNVPGIPIALDADKGAYYLPFEKLRKHLPPPVLLRLPGRKGEDRQVASSFEEFAAFEPRDAPPEE